MMKLILRAAAAFAVGLLFCGFCLFVPAGTLRWPCALLFLAILFIPMLLLGLILFFRAPELLAKRLQNKEKQSVQRGVIALSAVMFIGGFAAAGLDFRFGWTRVPAWLTAAAAVIFLISYALYAEVMRENAYLSRTVEVQKDQKVIDTGLYGIVRHPMYAVTVLLFLSIPLVLGSWISLIFFLPYPVLIAFRIRGEEELLSAELPGYDEYRRKVKYRLIPFIW